MRSCCGGNGDAIIQARQYLEGAPVVAEVITPAEDGKVRMEFIGDQWGAVTWVGKTGTQYRAGREPNSRYINAEPGDVDHLELLGVFAVVPGQLLRPPPAPVAPPIPTEPEPPTMDAAPLTVPMDDAMNAADEAALNARVQAMAREQRERERV